jgi:hypothetical protein
VDALGDGLEHLNVNGRRRAIVPVILEFIFADNTLGTLKKCKGKSRLHSDARNNRADVEGEYRGVHIDIIWVENGRILRRR